MTTISICGQSFPSIRSMLGYGSSYLHAMSSTLSVPALCMHRTPNPPRQALALALFDSSSTSCPPGIFHPSNAPSISRNSGRSVTMGFVCHLCGWCNLCSLCNSSYDESYRGWTVKLYRYMHRTTPFSLTWVINRQSPR